MKISVIIPIYNVEKYLAQCLESVIYQTYKNLEIICVDDGSPDNSAAIYEKYARLDSRIKIVKQANGGPSVARNTGLDAATGEYVHFFDSDDYIDLDFYEKMLTAAVDTDADIAACSVVSQNGIRYVRTYENRVLLVSTGEKFKITNSLCCSVVWSYIFRREFLLKNDFHFAVGRIFEDKLFIFDVMLAANRVVTVPNANYYYVKNPDSLMNKKYTKNHEEHWKYAENHRIEFAKKHNLQHLIHSDGIQIYTYKFLWFNLLAKHVGEDAIRWRLCGIQVLKIKKQ